MSTEKIIKIAGKDVAARLGQLGVTSLSHVAKFQKEELMQIKGIGPKTAKKLLSAAGVKVQGEKKAYSRLKQRTRLQGVKAFVKKKAKYVRKVLDDPEPTLQTFDDFNEAITSTYNFLGKIKSFGKPESEKVKEEFARSIPRSISLSMFAPRAVEKQYYLELIVKRSDQGFIIMRNLYDLERNNELVDQIPVTVPVETINTSAMQKVYAKLIELYEQFQESVREGFATIVLNSDTDVLENRLEQKLSRDLKKETVTIYRSLKKYSQFGIINTFIANNEFDRINDRLKKFLVYFHYRDDVKNDPKISSFDKYKKDYAVDMKQWMLENEDNKLLGQLFNEPADVKFGVIQSYKYRWDKNYEKVPREYDIKYGKPADYKEFLTRLTEIPVTVKKTTIPMAVANMIEYVFNDDYTIWYREEGFPVIFQSNNVKQLGFIVGG
jgi:hypothetical protein